MFSAVWTSAPDTTTGKNNLYKTCGISTGVQRCLDIGTKHNNAHEQLVQDLWNLHGCSALSGHRNQTQQRARTTCTRTAPVESPRVFSAVWTSAPDTTTCTNNLPKNGTCGISTGVLRCLAIPTRHNNVHEQLAEERHLWKLQGCSALSGHPHQTQQRARKTCPRTAPVESPRVFCAVWTSAPDTTTGNEQLVQDLWNLHGCSALSGHRHQTQQRAMNNLSKNGTCGVSTGVQRCLDNGTRHNNVHEQLVQERHLWNLHGCSALSGHRHQTQQRARTTFRRTAPVESPRVFCAVWTSAPDTTTCMNNFPKNGTCGISTGVQRCLDIGTRHNNEQEQLAEERHLWNLHGCSTLSGHRHQTQQRA